MGEEMLDFVLVEDDEDHALLVRKTLEAERISNSLRVFEDGESALAFLKGPRITAPTVLLIDINLPGMSGLELVAQIKAIPGLAHAPTVILSTSETERDRVAAYEAGANSYLTKPLDFEQFRRMIRDAGLYWGVWNRGKR